MTISLPARIQNARYQSAVQFGRICAIAIGLFAMLSPKSARAGGNHISVEIRAGATWDTNIDSSSGGRDDISLSYGAKMDYARRAGILSVDVGIDVSRQEFSRHKDESATDGSISLRISKNRMGRLTGSLSAGASRTRNPDSAINARTETTTYPLSLALNYPVHDKLSVGTSSAWTQTSYADSGLFDHYSLANGVNVSYHYNSKLDAVVGANWKSAGGANGAASRSSYDVTAGFTGQLRPKLTGTARFGYWQERHPDGKATTAPSFTTSLSWTATRKLSLVLLGSRSVVISGDGASVDATSARLGADYALMRKLRLNGGLSTGSNRFVFPQERTDRNWGWDAGVSWSIKTSVSLGASYSERTSKSSSSAGNFNQGTASVSLSVKL